MLYGLNREAIRRKLLDSCFHGSGQSKQHNTGKSIQRKPLTEVPESQSNRKIDCYSVVRMDRKNGEEHKRKSAASGSVDGINRKPLLQSARELQNSIVVSRHQCATHMPERCSTELSKLGRLVQQGTRPPLQSIPQNYTLSMSKRVMLKLKTKESCQTSNHQGSKVPSGSNDSKKQSRENSASQITRKKSGLNLTSSLKRSSSRQSSSFLPEPILSTCAQRCLQTSGGTRMKLRLTESTLRSTTWDRIPTISSNFINTQPTEY